MLAKNRFAHTFAQKLILWAAVLLCMWELLQKQRVTDAILAFCCAGVVPGTKVVLSPDAVIRLAAGVLAVGGLLLCIKPVVHILKRRRLLSTAAAIAVMLAAAPLSVSPSPAKLLAEAAPRPSRPARKLTAHRSLRLPKWPPEAISIRTSWLAKQVRLAALLAVRLLDRSVGYGMQAGSAAAVVCRMTALRFAKSAATKSVALWHWAEPHFRRFDAWLEGQVRATQKSLAKKIAAHEDALFVLNVMRECWQLLSRVPATLRPGSKTAKKSSDEI